MRLLPEAAARRQPSAKQELGEARRAVHTQWHEELAGEGVTGGGRPLEGTDIVGLGSGSRPDS